MPLLNAPPEPSNWIEPDAVGRPAVIFGIMTDTVTRLDFDFHSRKSGHLLVSQRGALSCEAEGGLWIVPPQSAFWIPGGTVHAIRATGLLEGYSAFIEPNVLVNLPQVCCTLSATPLLRELLIRSAHLPVLYPEGGMETHLVTLLLDEIAAAKVERLHLPMPTDARLRRIVDLIMANPADRRPMGAWASVAGLSERTMARLLSRQTGMSFRRWRQQLSIMLAVKWMAEGLSIQQVTTDLGYESVPSFVTMFRKALGTSPGRYMAERRSAR